MHQKQSIISRRLRKLKHWSWMVTMAYMLGLAKPYRDGEALVSLMEIRVDEREPEEEPSIGVAQWTFEEATFFHKTGFGYFPRN